MVAHGFNPSTWEAEAGGISEFEASLVYSEFKTARAIERNPVLKKKLKTKKNFPFAKIDTITQSSTGQNAETNC